MVVLSYITVSPSLSLLFDVVLIYFTLPSIFKYPNTLVTKIIGGSHMTIYEIEDICNLLKNG